MDIFDIENFEVKVDDILSSSSIDKENEEVITSNFTAPKKSKTNKSKNIKKTVQMKAVSEQDQKLINDFINKLSIGDSNKQVYQLKEILQKNNYDCGVINNVYGPLTKKAVDEYLKDYK